MTIRLDHIIVAAKDKVTSAIIYPHEQGRPPWPEIYNRPSYPCEATLFT